MTSRKTKVNSLELLGVLQFLSNLFLLNLTSLIAGLRTVLARMNPSSSFFYSRLLAIFSLFCFKCKEGKPEVNMKRNGTMVTVYQDCRRCGAKSFEWKSQPLILGKYPAGNILLSFAILMAGASVTKVFLVCRHLGLSVYCARTFFLHQTRFLFPIILKH